MSDMKEIVCPACGYAQAYEDGNTVLLCDSCSELIFVPDEVEDQL